MAEHFRAVVAMNDGVDSSVAALRMMERGYDCVGVTMKLFDNADAGISRERTCCLLEDVEDARNSATRWVSATTSATSRGSFAHR